ncbi:MAG: TVP38/TMEM64 family protein [Gemmataceae bacterium]|nr:TVP38/TMEM64 family protein [Gemmataceae bacterium]
MGLISSAPSRWSLLARLIVAVIVLVIALLLYLSNIHEVLSWENVRAQIQGWKQWVAERPVTAMLLFAAVYIAVTALSIPVSTGLSIVAGALFGRWWGVAIVSLSATIGATLAMWTSRYLFRDMVEQRFGEHLRPIMRGMERDGGWYLLSIRLAAIFPYFLVNLAMGLTPISTRSYVAATWLGMLPASFLFVNAGSAAMTIRSPGDVLSGEVLIALILVATVPLLLRRMIHSRGGSNSRSAVDPGGDDSGH